MRKTMILDEKVIYLEYFALRYKENFTLSALKKIHFHEFLNKYKWKVYIPIDQS